MKITEALHISPERDKLIGDKVEQTFLKNGNDIAADLADIVAFCDNKEESAFATMWYLRMNAGAKEIAEKIQMKGN